MSSPIPVRNGFRGGLLLALAGTLAGALVDIVWTQIQVARHGCEMMEIQMYGD